MKVTIRPLRAEEVPAFWQLAFADPTASWRQYNAPYFDETLPTLAEFEQETAAGDWLATPWKQVIAVDATPVGMVAAFYEDDALQHWLEFGLVIYQEGLWGHHIGRQALSQWIDHLFATTALPHLGFTTWSGNPRMIQLGKSLGMREEARVRQVRYWQGKYWDSVKYGILRSEWQSQTN